MTDRALRHQLVAKFSLECGQVLEEVRQGYRLEGALSPARDNLIVVLHALTGSPWAAQDWWQEVVGPGRALDTRHYAVLVPNLLGSCYGTTSRPGGDALSPVTPRDQARLVGLLVDSLGVDEVALVIGGSLGGMVALEWNLCHPGRARRTLVLAAPAATPASAIAWNHIQLEALELGGRQGLALARMVAMMTYRTEAEFAGRFNRAVNAEGRFEVTSYLARHGEKLVARFDPSSYRALVGAMDGHDVGRGRGGLEQALSALTGSVTGVGIPGDRLYDDALVREWTRIAGARYHAIESIHGHDAFLIEFPQVSHIILTALGEEGRAGALPRGRIAAARGET